ncbi:MAG: hypothetical protein KatS3mg032_1294 [Cyclobacteriaceae bacterium]|nr:MAG: hypothetical protein KatS3mg032_1294 [Cyclobacteriaceae bacterium]
MAGRLLVIFFLLPVAAWAQTKQENMWNILAEVGFESRPAKENGFEIESPRFSKRLWSYNGKIIRIKGYLVPLAELGGQNKFMLSALPFNQCYFCGGAGPETVVELQTKQPVKFVTRQITVEGVLQLNDADPDHHIYVLKNARVLDP